MIDKIVLVNVCRKNGHQIHSLVTEQGITPKGDVVSTFKLFCVGCGGDMEEISKAARLGPVSRRKTRGSGLADPPPPIEGQAQELDI
jgi:hypothetical protein